ncbi:MAG: sulfite exporter TauE/SafE family protein [Desulfopila sp.]
MTELSIIMLAWFAGGFVNGVAGFGAAMVAMPLLAPFLDLSVAVPSCTLIVLCLNIQVGWTFRRFIEWRYLKGIVYGAVPGVIVSMLVLEYIAEKQLKAGMGIFITCYALWNLWAGKTTTRTISHLWGYLSGILSSAFGMAFGFNGPPLAIYVAYCGCPSQSVKGILGAGFIITSSCIVLAKFATGQVDKTVLIIFAAATPAVIIGSKLGIKLSASLSEYSYRKLLFLALAMMGMKITWSGLI